MATRVNPDVRVPKVQILQKIHRRKKPKIVVPIPRNQPEEYKNVQQRHLAVGRPPARALHHPNAVIAEIVADARRQSPNDALPRVANHAADLDLDRIAAVIAVTAAAADGRGHAAVAVGRAHARTTPVGVRGPISIENDVDCANIAQGYSYTPRLYTNPSM